jgi:hypothetical protein
MSTNLEIKSLVKAAKELNAVMCLEPKIKLIGVGKEDLEEAITVNAEDIHWVDGVDEDGDSYEADSFSDETLAVLEALGVGDPANKVKKAPKKSKEEEIDDAENDDQVVKVRAEKDKAKKAAAAPEKKTSKKPEPEPEDEDMEDEENAENLEARLQVAKKMDDLNEIITDFPDVFTKKVVKGLAEFKNPIMLKKAMKEAAGIAPAEKVEKVKKERKEKAEKESRMGKPTAVGVALKQNPKTISEWEKSFDALRVKNGSPSNMKEAKAFINYMLPLLDMFEIDYPKK